MSTDAAYYKSRGMVRHTMILRDEDKAKLIELAKDYKITQTEVVETLLACAALHDVASALANFRQNKIANRAAKADLAKRLKSMTPEQLAEIQKVIEGNQQ